MYYDYFGFDRAPFSLTPDTEFFFPYPDHDAALLTTLAALQMGEGIIKVTGEVGSGKSLVCRKLLNNMPDDFVSAYLPNPNLDPKQLLRTIADELYIKHSAKSTPYQLVKAITFSLVEKAKKKKHVVMVIDEAQAMPLQTLETLRLLTNLETEQRKLLQIVLFAQPELDRKLELPQIRQLAQRITFSSVIKPMKPTHTNVQAYLNHRLRTAGYQRGDLFSPDAIKRLAKASHGTPRILNILASKALLVAYGQRASKVTSEHVKASIKDSSTVIKSLHKRKFSRLSNMLSNV